jgi:hypothetical protein
VHVLIPDAEAICFQWSKAFYYNVALVGQAIGEPPVALIAEIENDTLLSAVPHLKCRRRSCLIALRRLNFDDLGAVIGQDHGC